MAQLASALKHARSLGSTRSARGPKHARMSDRSRTVRECMRLPRAAAGAIAELSRGHSRRVSSTLVTVLPSRPSWGAASEQRVRFDAAQAAGSAPLRADKHLSANQTFELLSTLLWCSAPPGCGACGELDRLLRLSRRSPQLSAVAPLFAAARAHPQRMARSA